MTAGDLAYLWLARLSKVPEGGLLKRGRKVYTIAAGVDAWSRAPAIGDVQRGAENGMRGLECSRKVGGGCWLSLRLHATACGDEDDRSTARNLL